MSFEIKKASRKGVVPLIGLYSESGCGKTFSSLLLARGLVGASGRIVVIDTESGRASLYSDVIEGGYDVLDLSDNFSPMRYREAFKAAIGAKADCIIIDSMSHEWEGNGGVLSMAAEVEEKTGKPGLHCWKVPKFEHNNLMLTLLQSPVPVIVCLRAHYKSRQQKNAKTGKAEIVKDDFTTPIQSEAFIFEMTVHAEIMPDHSLRVTKCSHPALQSVFVTGQPITLQTGVHLASWCAGGKNVQTPCQPTDELKTLKKRLWDITENIHGGKLEILESHLYEKGLLSIESGERLAGCSVERLKEIVSKLEVKQ